MQNNSFNNLNSHHNNSINNNNSSSSSSSNPRRILDRLILRVRRVASADLKPEVAAAEARAVRRDCSTAA